MRDEQELVGDIWSVIGDGFNFPCGAVLGVEVPELDLEAADRVLWALQVAIGDKPEGLADEKGVALGWGANRDTGDQGQELGTAGCGKEKQEREGKEWARSDGVLLGVDATWRHGLTSLSDKARLDFPQPRRDAERPRAQRPGKAIIDLKPRPGRVRCSELII